MYAGATGFRHACRDLLELENDEEQRKLAEFVLSSAGLDPRLAAGALCELANNLEDPSLWDRAVKACAPKAGLATISDELKLEAIEHFGFDAVKDGYDAPF